VERHKHKTLNSLSQVPLVHGVHTERSADVLMARTVSRDKGKKSVGICSEPVWLPESASGWATDPDTKENI